MTQNSRDQDETLCRLKDQIREAYGKVLLNQKCHERMAYRVERTNLWLKRGQIVLSVITTSGFAGVAAAPQATPNLLTAAVPYLGLGGTILAALSLMLNAYLKDFNLNEQIRNHQEAANKLWKLKEEYLSLLVDFNALEMEDIRAKRDELQNKTNKVYNESPRFDDKSRAKAQKALQIDREHPFFCAKINGLLPESLRDDVAPKKRAEGAKAQA